VGGVPRQAIEENAVHIFIQKTINFLTTGNRWYVAVCAGFFYALGVPPFDSQMHPVFTFFPLLSFIICIPLFLFSINASIKRAILQTYLFGFTASLGQLYWIAFVTPEGLWHLIVLGVLLITLFEALFYTANGLLFRVVYKKFPRLFMVFVPAAWVCIEYLRSVGEISFPWTTLGYSLTPLLFFSQISSITGVYGMSFLIVLGNTIVLEEAQRYAGFKKAWKKGAYIGTFTVCVLGISFWGWHRLHASGASGPTAALSLVQPNIDQNKWGNHSLDTAFDVIESLVYASAQYRPGVIILPESALLCYLVRRPPLKQRVIGWSQKTKIPLVLGALHWDVAPPHSLTEYFVYNTVFFLDSGSATFVPYYKMNLVPFSEVLPFQGLFPILSRVNLGQADFKRGATPVVFSIGKDIRAVPLVCYEIIYPGFVRGRLTKTTNLLINVTNDGWFGKSSGPFQHAVMSRQRCIENGISLARCANSGISMLVDQYGRILSKTRLGERTRLSGTMSLSRVATFYSRWGDWPAALSLGLVAIMSALMVLIKRNKK
jgi:apolipoprotein N-acyltransferase